MFCSPAGAKYPFFRLELTDYFSICFEAKATVQQKLHNKLLQEFTIREEKLKQY